MKTAAANRILISGASIAGPTLGYWLHRYGFDVTLVERAEAIRSGGYPIDIRGTAMDVVERMGILEGVKAAHLRTREWRFVDAEGRRVGGFRPEDLTGGVAGRDVELPRGTLTSLLYELTRNTIQYRFKDFITALNDGPDGIDVTFNSGRQERFDLVIAADGLHSSTRALVFGPEDQFKHYLGYTFAGFTMPNTYGLSQEAVIHSKPGKLAMVFSPDGGPHLGALLALKRPEPSRAELSDADAQRQAMIRDFSGGGWLIPDLLKGIQAADDLYFDSMMQIFMPTWSSGRVAVVGDAAYGPSFFSGQGTSIALVGAYVLAGELATHADHTAAFRAYEQVARDFVEGNQAVAKDGGETMVPDTELKLWLRNKMMGLAPLLSRLGLVGRTTRKRASALTLDNYEEKIRLASAA